MTEATAPPLHVTEQLSETRLRVVSLVPVLNADELAVVELVTRGLVQGRTEYIEQHADHDARTHVRDALVVLTAQVNSSIHSMRRAP